MRGASCVSYALANPPLRVLGGVGGDRGGGGSIVLECRWCRSVVIRAGLTNASKAEGALHPPQRRSCGPPGPRIPQRSESRSSLRPRRRRRAAEGGAGRAAFAKKGGRATRRDPTVSPACATCTRGRGSVKGERRLSQSRVGFGRRAGGPFERSRALERTC